MKQLIIIHMRNGGCFITQSTDEAISTLAKRLHGGHAVFCDELWGKRRELAINLADVSAVELKEE